MNIFQYCDIHVERIQHMLKQVPAPVHGAKCNEKTGWLPAGFDEQCREIMLSILREYYQMEIQEQLKGDGGREWQSGDEEEDEEDDTEQDQDDQDLENE